MKRTLSLGLAAALWIGLWPAERAEASLTQESLRSYIQRIGAKIESAKGGLFVTSVMSGKSKVEIRLLNDAAKQRLGMYAYGFGNVSNAKDAAALYEYLLRANSELGIGGFFVDKDNDIGFKFLLDTRDPLSFDTFSIVYIAMANVIAEHRPEIAKMLQSSDQPQETPADDSPPPAAESPGATARRRR